MITFLRMTRLYIPKVNLMTLLLKFVIPTFISVRVHKNILSHSVKSCPPLGLTSSPQRGVFDKDVERGRQRGVFDAAPLIGQWAFDTVWPIPGISLFGMGGSYRGSFLLLLLVGGVRSSHQLLQALWTKEWSILISLVWSFGIRQYIWELGG